MPKLNCWLAGSIAMPWFSADTWVFEFSTILEYWQDKGIYEFPVSIATKV